MLVLKQEGALYIFPPGDTKTNPTQSTYSIWCYTNQNCVLYLFLKLNEENPVVLRVIVVVCWDGRGVMTNKVRRHKQSGGDNCRNKYCQNECCRNKYCQNKYFQNNWQNEYRRGCLHGAVLLHVGQVGAGSLT